MRRILVIKHGAFGDVVQCDGALRDIRLDAADAEISVLTTPAFQRIFKRCPHVDRVIIDPRAPRWRLDLMHGLRSVLRAEKFDMVFDLQNSARTSSYFKWFLNDVKWSGTAPGCSHPHLAPCPKDIHAIERMADQLKDAGLTVHHTRNPDLSWMADDVQPILADAAVSRPYVVLIAGSSQRHPQKRWPHYAQLASRLIDQGYHIVTVPGPDELATADAMPGKVLKGPRGYLNWFELAGVLQGAAFAVGNDTGPSHLASHLGVPGLALFGPHTTAERTGIKRPNFGVIEVGDLSELPVDRVMSAIQKRLSRA